MQAGESFCVLIIVDHVSGEMCESFVIWAVFKTLGWYFMKSQLVHRNRDFMAYPMIPMYLGSKILYK